MEDEFLQFPQAQHDAGIPYLDTRGTSNPMDPYSMIAPGAVDPEDDYPPEVIQAAQEDLVSRAMLAMTDTRQPKEGEMSPADSFLQLINIRGATAPEAIGKAAGTLMIALTQNAKRQGVEYPTEVLLGGGAEVTMLTMDIAREAGIFPDIPEDENDPAYEQVFTASVLEAAKTFGEFLVSTGQVDQAQYREILHSVMEEEAALGELDDWDPMSQIGPQQLADLVGRGVGAAHQFAQQAEQEVPPEQEV